MENEKLTDQELMILAASSKPVVVLLSAELLAARKRIAELVPLLEEWHRLHDEPCRLDHHGKCQIHFIQQDCIVKRTAAALSNRGES